MLLQRRQVLNHWDPCHFVPHEDAVAHWLADLVVWPNALPQLVERSNMGLPLRLAVALDHYRAQVESDQLESLDFQML